MANTNLTQWQASLPQEVVARAYRSSDEFAWSRHDALQVASALEKKGYRILGVDIWVPTLPGPTIPTPFVYDWDDANPISATEFIRTFEWDKSDRSHLGMQPYFNILVD